MRIRIIKKNNRNKLICVRGDGSFTDASLGPKLPFHDIAHYVVENTLGLRKGFYGMIASGHSIEELSSTAFIRTLGPTAWVAEIVTRALQSLSSGACTTEQFREMIFAEMSDEQKADCPEITDETISKMNSEYLALLKKWEEVPDGSELEMQFAA